MRRRSFLAGATAIGAMPRLALAGDGLRIAVISDLNSSYGSTSYGPAVHAAVDRILALRPDLVLCTGDMVAGQRAAPKFTDAELDAMWQAFHSVVTDPLARAGLPLLVTPGNHDASAYPGFERERDAFDRTWTENSPSVEIIDGERYPFRYAVSHGEVLFVCLDINMSGPLAAEEMDWLQMILQSEGPKHHARIVFGHLPIWAITQGRETEIIGDPAFQTMLMKNGAGVYLSGHHHAYYPGRAGGLLQLAQACLGDDPRKLIGTSHRTPRAMTVLEVAADGTINHQAYLAEDFETRIKADSLPPSLVRGRSRLDRSDLVG